MLNSAVKEKGRPSSLKEFKGIFLLFETTHLTMKAETVLKSASIPFRLFPKPKGVISECGIIVKIADDDLKMATLTCEDAGLNIKKVLSIP